MSDEFFPLVEQVYRLKENEAADAEPDLENTLLSTSPPRYPVFRVADGGVARRRQMAMCDMAQRFRYHSMTQYTLHRKNTQMTCLAIMTDSYLISPLVVETRREESHFWHIATKCPLEASEDTRLLMLQYIEENVDGLTEELRVLFDRVVQHKRGVDVDDMCTATNLQIITDTIETVRCLAAMLLMRSRREASLISTSKTNKSAIKRQFDASVDISRLGHFATQLDPENAIDPICRETFVIEPPTGGNGAVPSRFVLNCCGNSICPKCVREHAFPNSEMGYRTAATCVYCRGNWDIWGIGSNNNSTTAVHQHEAAPMESVDED